ncbi:MAG: NAD(P)/FAD-dependent oxidoreductase [Actinomycetota bacterium]|nr:NAD(P)/FAD-dependent oxidoreductase [Actinomycetota bacterium]
MPTRSTKRGADRTPLAGDFDVIVCGASFAGLTVTRQLTGSGARVLLLDRYDIGERQTSACGIPTGWLHAMGLEASARQEFGTLVVHTPHGTSRYDLPWSFSTFDYRTLCEILHDGCDAEFETAKVEGRATQREADDPAQGAKRPTHRPITGSAGRLVTVRTDRGEVSAPLVVDALGWRRVLASAGYQPPDAPLSRGLEVHPPGSGEDLEIWIDRRYVPAGYGWSFPAGSETRIGVGSFDPGFHVKETTVLLAEDLEREPVRYQGNWIPHKLRRAAEGGVFFAGDSAGHCLPLTAEGIRTAFYFAIALGEELRAVVERRKTRDAAIRDYAAFNDSHEWKFNWLLHAQRTVPRFPARAQRGLVAAAGSKRFVDWSFGHYLEIAHPRYAEQHARRTTDARAPVAASFV